VRSNGDSTIVEMINPQTMVDVTSNAEMGAVAGEVTALLEAALAKVRN